MEKTLFNLSIGDEVIYCSRYSSKDQLLSVTSQTATQIVCGNKRFMKKTGNEIGSASSKYSTSFISVGTPERIAKAKSEKSRMELIEDIKATNLYTLTLDQLTRIKAIMEEGK